MGRGSALGEFEQMVLLAILRLGDEAYAIGISEALERHAGRRVSRGALYSSLDRLEGKGFLLWDVAPTGPERSGQPRRRFRVTPAGVEAVRRAHAAWRAMTSGLDAVLEGPPE